MLHSSGGSAGGQSQLADQYSPSPPPAAVNGGSSTARAGGDFDLHAFRAHMAAAMDGMTHSQGGSVAAAAATAAIVGPATYTPRFELSSTTAPRAQFGQAHRFLPAKVGYISPQHNSDLLCTASPGPKYNITPTEATFPRQPAVGWGDKTTAMQREKKASFIVEDGPDGGPAAYSPRVAIVKPSAPRCAFSRSSRFGGPFGSYQTLSNTSSSVSMNNGTGPPPPIPSFDAITSQSPRFSFGPPRTPRDPQQQQRSQEIVYKPRTSFMTHSIAGGLARSATMECGIGPGAYEPHLPDEIGSTGHQIVHENNAKSGFGSSARFTKPGVQYFSAEHARVNIGQGSPGPKYLVQLGTTGYQPQCVVRSSTAGLRWCP